MEFTPDRIAEIAKAKRMAIDGRTTLWNLRLEALVEAGSVRDAIDFASSAVEDTINNCGCNVQCGAALERGQIGRAMG